MPQHPVRRAFAAAGLVVSALSIGLPALAQGYVQDYLPINIIHDFGTNEPGGSVAGLIFDKAGNLYGTESDYGGSPAYVNGAIFKLSPPLAGSPAKGWKETVLHAFTGGGDGAVPNSQLYIDNTGNLYGVTTQGGNGGCYNNLGCGTIFELSPPGIGQKDWTKKILYNFTGGADGAYPGLDYSFQLVTDGSGNLYGSTSQGSGAPCSSVGCANIFELSPPTDGQTEWSFKVIYAFGQNTVYGTLARDASGSLYGMTVSSAFRLSPPSGGQTVWTETEIASLGKLSTTNGLIFDQGGNLYGTIRGNGGRIFKLSPPSKGTRWALSFPADLSPSDGADPNCLLTIDAAGNLYGTTDAGAHNNGGTVFKLTPDGTMTVLHKFDGNRDGSVPIGGPVIFDASGNIYGTSSTGGAGYNGGSGAVWELLVH